MAGMIADLDWDGILVPQGYVEIDHIQGGPNYQLDQFEKGSWLAHLSYYKSYGGKKIPIDDPSFTQISIPYVVGNDPYVDVGMVLRSWFPKGTVVT